MTLNLRIDPRKLRVHKDVLGQILKIGIPAGMHHICRSELWGREGGPLPENVKTLPAAKSGEHYGGQRTDSSVQPASARHFQYRSGCNRNRADSAGIHFLRVFVQLCPGGTVRLSERLWCFLHTGGLRGHRNMRRASHMDIHNVPAETIFHNHYAGVPD